MNNVANQPFYHLRPNKSIDRSLFVQTLIGLSRKLSISDYHYTGFGSYFFDDFKLLHETFNISKMVSLEVDHAEFERAKFNRPYGCIEIKNTSSTEYLSELMLDDEDHHIFWLDFVKPSELGQQLADFATLLNLLNPYDIVRITLNANPDSLGKSQKADELQKIRLEELKKRVQDKYLPHSLSTDDVTKPKYPLTLLNILKAVSTEVLEDNPPYSPNFLLPLFSSVYADGQQMLTFTGIVLDSHEEEKSIYEMLTNYKHHTFCWDNPCKIEIPALTIREITELNKLLPNPEIQQQLIKEFPFIFSAKDKSTVDSYISYYKFYPHYHQVSF